MTFLYMVVSARCGDGTVDALEQIAGFLFNESHVAVTGTRS